MQNDLHSIFKLDQYVRTYVCTLCSNDKIANKSCIAIVANNNYNNFCVKETSVLKSTSFNFKEKKQLVTVII